MRAVHTQANVPVSMRLIFFFHMVGSFIHIIFFTYICGGLIEESSNIGLATYSGWWTVLPMDEAGRMLREDVKVMIMKSMRPCYLSAGGFFPVSLETSTAVRHPFDFLRILYFFPKCLILLRKLLSVIYLYSSKLIIFYVLIFLRVYLKFFISIFHYFNIIYVYMYIRNVNFFVKDNKLK